MGDNSSGEGVINLNGGLFDTSYGIMVGFDGTGIITQTDGIFNGQIITLGDDNFSTGTYIISGGTLSASLLELGIHYTRTSASTFDIQNKNADITFTTGFSILSAGSVFNAVPGSKIKMVSEYANFINELDAANQLNVSGLGNLTMKFSDNPTATYCTYEVSCEDRDPNIIGYCGGNFTLDTLAVGGSTPGKVALVDSFDNGNRGSSSKCLYVRKLIVTAGSTLNLGGLNLYYREAEIAGTVNGTPTYIGNTDIDDSGLVNVEDVKIVANNWLSTGCTCPDYCNGADINLDGRVDLQDLAFVAMDWLEGEGGGGGTFWNETFDSDPIWTTDGQWAFGTPTGDGGLSYGYPDPASGYTGDNVYGVNLTGDYSTTPGTYLHLTTPVIDCTGQYGVVLNFKRWLNIDIQARVVAIVDIYDGSFWFNFAWDNSAGTTTDSGWTDCSYDISEWADNNPDLRIRWSYWVKAGALPYSGWNIDDVELRAMP